MVFEVIGRTNICNRFLFETNEGLFLALESRAIVGLPKSNMTIDTKLKLTLSDFDFEKYQVGQVLKPMAGSVCRIKYQKFVERFQAVRP